MGRRSKLGIFGMLKSKHPHLLLDVFLGVPNSWAKIGKDGGAHQVGAWIYDEAKTCPLVHPSTDYPTGIFLSLFFSDYPHIYESICISHPFDGFWVFSDVASDQVRKSQGELMTWVPTTTCESGQPWPNRCRHWSHGHHGAGAGSLGKNGMMKFWT